MDRLFFGVILRVVHEKEAKENVFLESKSDVTIRAKMYVKYELCRKKES